MGEIFSRFARYSSTKYLKQLNKKMKIKKIKKKGVNKMTNDELKELILEQNCMG